ncbi:oligo-1,6-glucosidase [Caloranaerobacter sp. TR13]|uniref:glycoside hydrolase family 13 protein n=1 Tax=Caloranaerobacter sp. TR13 TaxID=1302151 RepID=UPI0006D3A9E3|nr:alpha-glucosidase [Caloranaerobacter sp. TR13]KPU26925.1 oligo-1,6-glucosidase [Caloranaerobacter sp. TR13]
MEKKWWKESVIYQVYPRSFYDSNGDGIGDLRGIIQKLDYIKDLGANVIWLNPVYKSPNTDNGYDISDYYDIMDEFGTMEDFDELLEEVHKRGMKLIMDLVVNHTSDEHIWFIESRSSKDNPYRDFYIWRPGKDGKEPNNWLSMFGGSAWKYDEKTNEYYLHIFAEKQPDLNWENPKVREEVYKMMKWWLDKGIDGFRMDVINFISKVNELPDDLDAEDENRLPGSKYYLNGPKVHDYLKEMNEKVLSKYDVMTVGETPGVTPEIAKLYVNSDRNELNMLFQFELMGLDCGPSGKWDTVPWSLRDFKKIMYKWYLALKDKGWNSLYLNNHDQPRSLSRFGNDEKYRVESAKLLATLVHTWHGTPYIYQGEEIGMTNIKLEDINDYRDIETFNFYKEKIKEGWDVQKIMDAIHVKSRDNARTPMQWSSEANGGFTSGEPWIKVNPNYKTINVENELKNPDSILNYYKKLIKLRAENDIIVYGDVKLILEEDDNIFAYLRTLEEERLFVLLNFSEEEVEFNMPDEIQCEDSVILLSNYKVDSNKIDNITLRPYEARIYRLY